MALLIKGAHVYAPEDLGICDVLTVGKQVVAVGKDLTATLPELETIDAKGLILTPGFIDQHIHVTGGGGEGGPKTRTPELVLSELIACGTTSVVGVSGTEPLHAQSARQGSRSSGRRRFGLDIHEQLCLSSDDAHELRAR